jgi:hypothetical protein
VTQPPHDSQPTQPGLRERVPQLGPVASGLVSFLLVSSLRLVAPVGLFFAPLALVPVLRLEGLTGRSIAAWLPVLVILGMVAALQPPGLALHLWIIYALMVAVPAATVSAWRHWGGSEGRWIAGAALTQALGLLIVLTLMTSPAPPDEGLRTLVGAQVAAAEELSEGAMTSAAGSRLMLDQAIQWAPVVLPTTVMSYAVLVLFWIRPRLRILGLDLPVGTFEDYRSEEWLPVAFVAFGVGALVLDGTPRFFAVNLLMTVLILYFVHGLAIIRAYLARWIGRGLLVRWGVALLALQTPISAAVAVLGMVDAFRPLRPRTTEDPDEHDRDSE